GTESLAEGLNNTIKVLSVFSGIGMFDYPLFEDKTFEIVKAIEINKAACETYKKNIPKGSNWESLPKELCCPSFKIGKTHSNTYRRLELDKPSITLANYRKCNIIHPTENRGLSVAEALALSGFDNYKVLGSLSEKQQAISNGVPYFL